MSGWNSLESVSRLHGLLEIAGLVCLAVLLAAAAATYHYWRRWDDLIAIVDRARATYLPRWRASDSAAVLHNGLVEVGIVGVALLLATGYAALQYGQRKHELAAAAQTAGLERVRHEADALRRALAERDARAGNMLALRNALREGEVRHLAETAALRREIEQIQMRRATALGDRETEGRLAAEIETLRHAGDQAASRHAMEIAALRQNLQQSEMRRVAIVESLRWEVQQAEARAATEISRLQQQLTQTEKRLASIQAQRRLSEEEKHALIDALRPFPGQKVSIAAIDGDDDGKAYAEDFVEVFSAAGWQHAAVSYRHWERDPVGVEITLNEADGRAGRINTGVGALINIARKLSLVDGNTIYLTAEIPAGQVQIKIGKKLPR